MKRKLAATLWPSKAGHAEERCSLLPVGEMIKHLSPSELVLPARPRNAEISESLAAAQASKELINVSGACNNTMSFSVLSHSNRM